MQRLTRRFIINSLEGLNISKPLRYERYYINDNLRIQRKGDVLQEEILDDNNIIIKKMIITKDIFNKLQQMAYSKIIRNSYLCLDNKDISIKEYLDNYAGLLRVEVKFTSLEKMNSYIKEPWMGEEITYSKLAFDKDLSKLSKTEFQKELNKYLN